MANHKPYIYTKGRDPQLDADFAAAKAYSKVRPGATALFWRFGLHWHAIPYSNIRQIYRRVEPVYGKLCCGGKSFIIEWLVLILQDGTEVVLHIGDEIQKKAEDLLLHLKEAHPEIAYGKYN